MGNKMLIDAAHPEETRVVVLRGDRVEEFDFESASRKQLRGNIYLAKITRVESSLQAAFVDYGGNRHGFLAFNEIHPDYYQIPVADRRALLEEEAQLSRASANSGGDDAVAENGDSEQAEADSEPGAREEAGEMALDGVLPPEISEELAAAVSRAEEAADEIPPEVHAAKKQRLTERLEALTQDALEEEDSGPDETLDAEALREAETAPDEDANGDRRPVKEGEDVEAVGSGDALEEVPQRRPRKRRRNYKIQEVIRRRQILLVQVVKEERGNKGAALTTYLSLAGRYTVLMPNTASGGGISRKIASPADRKRLRQIVDELDVPEGMGLIIRTAGASRTKAEIKRDFEYLLRLWENVRDLTLQSTAPALVYEEGNLIKRSIRDLYSKEIDEVQVAGETAYREAKDFMRMIMPSHAKNVKPYREPEPIFIKNNVERQLDAMYSPYVTLKSGGYIVINQTEALVAIDVNSGKATKQHSIEDTALRTNMEAAEEISRQLRLRDLAGLIVIDFIDMEERRNNRAVERKLKESLRHDRARIQIGRISAFGLLEMSRQRIRTGVLEGSTSLCPHCQGTGIIRSVESVALSVLRALEDYLRSNKVMDLTAVTSGEVALYILNNKREYLNDIERRFGVRLGVVTDERMQGSSFTIERMAQEPGTETESNVVVQMDWGFEAPAEAKGESEEESRKRSRRKRRRSRNGRKEAEEAVASAEAQTAEEAGGAEEEARAEGETSDDAQRARKSRRRGRRGGRRQRARRESGTETGVSEAVGESAPGEESAAAEAVAEKPEPAEESAAAEATGRVEESAAPERAEVVVHPRAEGAVDVAEIEKAPAEHAEAEAQPAERQPADVVDMTAQQERPTAEERAETDAAEGGTTTAEAETETVTAEAEPERKPQRPRRRGWWQRR
ncbi:Rne/Rng family ribonuclease [Dichotomicrobium thermohalophilum]|uniref:Ribonuclease E n=1 Tax=Dichotomicrobium thermohalophilum TaxID=933063 RepID=A0A397QA77_9HYPH|nr:ribonuclease E/G [Dichotomicrobium thermohalophilum]RIA56705.1 RNAse E [Dichotomicrobium thermohalophilum]